MIDAPRAAGDRFRCIGVCAALFALTIALYWPVRGYDFVNLDDGLNVYNNPMVTSGLTPGGLRQAVQTSKPDYWRPVSWVSLMLDSSIYRIDPQHPDPMGYHFTNVLLHALNAVMLLLALRSLTGAFWRSAAVAAIFALHPLRIESVAWITERKDVLSGVFAFASLWAYVNYARRPSIPRMAVVTVLLALGRGIL